MRYLLLVLALVLLGIGIGHFITERKRVEKALTWWGFGNYAGPTWFSPHDREKQLRETLVGDDESRLVFLRARSSGPTSDRLIAQRCWDLDDLDADYHRFIQEFRPRLARYRRGIRGATALVESILLIHNYRRYPFRDPDLPDSLLPTGWRGRTAHQVFTEAHNLLRPPAEAFVAGIVEANTAVPDH